MKHTLVSIGYIGCKRVYLDVPREEAIRRYTQSEGETPDDGMVKEIAFDDEFWAYDIREKD